MSPRNTYIAVTVLSTIVVVVVAIALPNDTPFGVVIAFVVVIAFLPRKWIAQRLSRNHTASP